MSETPGWAVGDQRSLTHTFLSSEIDEFARLTGDTNPLHVDAAFANRSAAGGQVVHGMLAAAFVSTLVGMQIPGRGALWNAFEVNWRRMIRIGDVVRFEARVTAVHAATRMLDLEIVGVNMASGDVHLEGKARVMMMGERDTTRPAPLAGKRVLVTGATGEVGGAICRALSAAQCRVIAWGRDEGRLAALTRALGPESATGQLVDLNDSAQIDAAVSEFLALGAVDGVVHAAAAPLALADVGDASNQRHLRDHWQVDVAALQQIAGRVAGTMPKGSFIVGVLTQAVFDTPPTKMSAYVAAKMAAWGLIRCMAVELGPKGIRANAVSPGLMETPYVRDMPVRAKQVEAASNPLRRLCSVEDVAAAVVFLASPEAAYLNGMNLPVTGGSRMP